MTKPKTPAHSPSAIKMYRQCPAKYYHTKVLKEVPYKQGEAAARGDRTHLSIESHIKHGTEMQAAVVPSADKVASVIRKLRSRGELQGENEITIRRDESLTHARDWKDAWFRWKIDLTARMRLGSIVRIVDWKTGKSKYLDEFQLENYCIAESIENPDLEEVRADYMFLDEDGVIKGGVQMNRETIAIRKQELYEEAHEIESAVIRKRMPYKKGFLCQDYCDVKKLGLCKEFK